ncbi:Inositol 2-dehydrogenase [Maioricimonas rarisocia]|uniref:Inositol 2-dehydrogenase n=1 Tax=Maioricimonas rarisocia TaxID=2528026 RepID=A0A517Z3B8_9PLAN|nr:Gfo/Idh/MocA family oxidoreductase [Maioricimonas rarisocia]QDU36984.1 Inositol 2-dehydrogenase [Maioricimonas rarisocia]
MSRIKYGQIGVGHAHAGKLSVYRESDDYEVIGIVEPDPELRKRAENSPVFRDLPWMTAEELLNQPGLQVVGVETRIGDLLDTAEQCIAAGKHVHLDKPAGESFPQYQRILADAARQKLAVQMGYMYRYNPAVVMLRDFLQKGWLGEPFEVHCVMSKLMNAGSRQSLVEYTGGTMFELGCHLIDLVVGVLGGPQLVHAFPRHSSPIEDTLLDNMLAVFEYPNATATIRSSVNEVDGFARRHFVVCGTEGTFHIQPLDNPKAKVAFHTARGDYRKGYQEVEFPKYRRYVGDAADLAKIVRQEKEPDFTYEHDLAVQRSVLRASGLPVA